MSGILWDLIHHTTWNDPIYGVGSLFGVVFTLWVATRIKRKFGALSQ